MSAGKAQEVQLLGCIYCKALNSWHLIFIHCHLSNDFKENCGFKIREVNRVLASSGEEPVMSLL